MTALVVAGAAVFLLLGVAHAALDAEVLSQPWAADSDEP